MKKVLFVASEAVPFIKTGGLGDVVGSLPKELKRRGMDVRIIIPKYEDIPTQWREKMVFRTEITAPLGWRRQYCGLYEINHEGVIYYFIDNEYYFKRKGLYGYDDDAERFAFFCRAALNVIPLLDFEPGVIHCHDWHTALLPVMLQAYYKDAGSCYQKLRTVLTIHNIEYQGVFDRSVLGDLLEIPSADSAIVGKLDFFGKVNFLKGGIASADVVTTVSRTYAAEILTPEGGKQLDRFLPRYQKKLSGILNGIDYEVYNPETDNQIYAAYSPKTSEGKQVNKIKLQEYLCLPKDPKMPLIGIVSRLVAAKGLDLIATALDDLLSRDLQIVVLGMGDEKYESMFRIAAYHHPAKISANLYFDDTLAHRIYAGSDIFLMPSLSEPCGIGQLIALRYGSIPVVRETGGLNDTIEAYNEHTGLGNGFSFTNYNARDMLYTINRALSFYNDRDTWSKLVTAAMNSDFSWRRSAAEYAALY